MSKRLKEWLKGKIGSVIVLALVLIMVIAGSVSIKKARENAITFEDTYEAPEKTADLMSAGEYKSIAKSDSLELYFCEEKGAVQIKDLKSGHLWKTITDEEVYPTKGVNKQWVAYLQSPICISYNDLKKRDSGVKKVYAGKDCGSLDIEYIDNGVAVTYGFLTPGIFITVEYTLDGDELVVKVPWEKIREEWKYAVTTVELLPFFGACGNSNNGYIFYPDGSGAITCFDKVGERSSNVKVAYYYTYSNKTVSLLNMEDENLNRYAASMPVFGIKDGDHALFAYGTDGAENLGIATYPSGYVVNLNHLGFEVYVRNVFNVNMYNMSAGENTMATGGIVQRVDKNIIPEDKVIRYAFLSGDEADYSGMANTYREYLVDNGLLKSSISVSDNYPLSLEILMGTSKSGVVFDEYIAMTTFGQVKDMLEELKELNITDEKLVLTEWVKESANYNYWAPDRRLGGKSGLKDISEYAEENPGLELFLETAFAKCNSDTKGIDEDDDVVYDGLNIEIAGISQDRSVTYLTNPKAIFNRNNEFLKKLKKYDGVGIGYRYLGKYAYPDYNTLNPYTKPEMVKEVGNTLNSTKEADKSVAVKGANQYVYAYADYLYDLSEKSYGLSITDYAVPFVQMVISGYIPYSTAGAGNLSYDLPTQKLKWIEYGSLPYFYVTYKSALNLRETTNDTLFSSTWADWKPVIEETYKEFKNNFSCIYGKQMTEHKIITDDVSAVTYENGVKIYINYGDAEFTTDNVTIPGKGYVVTGGNK
ncbi:MAG: hypothetical protein IJS80_02365 [Lachnospiraceae bacterium]|nr:hypothetical protein [Lachnospiraceae bacterium]